MPVNRQFHLTNCVDVGDELEGSFDTLVFISHRHHFDDERDRPLSLFVVSDWLLYQELRQENVPTVSFELGLFHWADIEGEQPNIFLEANQWLYENGHDYTKFQGVSLGAPLCGEIGYLLVELKRTQHCIQYLIEKYGPSKVVGYDAFHETLLLPASDRKECLTRACAASNVRFIDHWQPTPAADSVTARIRQHSALHHVRVGWKRYLLNEVYNLLVHIVFKIPGGVGRSKKRVLLLTGRIITGQMLRVHWPDKIVPILLSEQQPKSIRLLADSFRKRVCLLPRLRKTLTKSELDAIDEIKYKIRNKYDNNTNFELGVVTKYVKSKIDDEDAFEKFAVEAKQARHIFKNQKPARIMVDGVKNLLPRAFIEMAPEFDVATDYIWHSPLIPHNTRFDVLVAETLDFPKIDRCLSWGPINTEWLKKTGCAAEIETTGAPHFNFFNRPYAQPDPNNAQRVLVLQYTPIISDFRGVHGSAYAYLIDVCRLLRKSGYTDVRVKLHPGGKTNPKYIERILQRFGREEPIIADMNYETALEWCDVVVGPVVSGAMLETIAAGKKYIPVALSPNCFDMSYYQLLNVATTVEEIGNSLRSAPPPPEPIMEAFYSSTSVSSASDRIWQLLSQATDQ